MSNKTPAACAERNDNEQIPIEDRTPMSLRIKLLIVFFGFVALGGAISTFVATRGMKRLVEENSKIAKEGIKEVVSQNIRLSSEILTKMGETFVSMEADQAALKIEDLLKKHHAPFNFDELRKDEKLRAVATANIRVPMKNGGVAGHIDLYDNTGLAIIHPNPNVEGQNYSKWAKEFPEMWRLVQKSFHNDNVNGYYSFIGEDNRKKRKYMALRRVPGTTFIVSAVVEINEFFLPAHKKIKEAGKRIENKAEKNVADASNENSENVIGNVALAFLALLMAGAVGAIWMANGVSKPIRELRGKAIAMGKGDFSSKIPEKGSREARDLAAAFNEMGDALTHYIEDLKRETATREAFESEVKTARKIQEALIPHTFPPFPDKQEFELFASLLPAKEVSGDFYDFFFVDNDTLALVMADVSGKGLPAAIFMAVARTLLRNLCLVTSDNSPESVLTKANDYLCDDNDEAMFVTVFLAFFNLQTGTLEYANAGHEPFLSLKKDEHPKRLGVLNDFPLGITKGHEFNHGKHCLDQNETIVLHTDGVTDATSQNGEFFGEKRFIDILEEHAEAAPRQIVDALNETLLSFQKENQFDDITVMALKRKTSEL